MASLTVFILAAVFIVSTVRSDCNVGNGRVIRSGQKFSYDKFGCVTYICEGEQYKVHKAKCVEKGKCINIGTRVTRDECVVFECGEIPHPDGKSIGFIRKEVHCPANGKCYPDGDTINLNGKNCKCKADDIAFQIICV